MKLRIAIGGIWHETNSFASGLTELDDFTAYQFAQGDELIERYRSTGTEIGGIIAQSAKDGHELVPALYAAAVPSGVISRETATFLVDELVKMMVVQSGLLDGVILSLHGAASAEGIADLDGYILERIKHSLGNTIPIIAIFDYHANVSESMVDNATVLIGYDSYPHTDMAERGAESVRVMAKILNDGIFPQKAFLRIPLLSQPLKQKTSEPPMLEIMDLLHELEKWPGVLCGSVAMGYPYSDVPHLGATVLIYGDQLDFLTPIAEKLALKIWKLRDKFLPTVMSVENGVTCAVGSKLYPVVIVEPADNIGGGSAGDGVSVLSELLVRNAERATVVIADPQAVETIVSAGSGKLISVYIGGKTDNKHGPTIEITGRVRSISNGEYVHKGSYMTGYTTSMGTTAVVDVNGVNVVISSRRSMPFDAEQLRCVGIEPAEQKIIAVKSAIAWEAAYGEIAKKVVIVDSPGVCAIDPNRFDYQNRPRPLYPLETNFDYSP